MLGVEQFSFKNAQKGILHLRCRSCCRQFARQHYARAKATYLERNRRNNPVQRLAARRFVHQFLLAHPCVQCGETDPIVLEFNHLDPTAKAGNLCDLVHGRSSLARLRAEIARCEVLCANCHQRHTTLVRPVHYKRANATERSDRADGPRPTAILRNQMLLLEYLAGTGRPRQRLAEELAKCDVRCANCHRRRTAVSLGWFRARGR
jgi:hypothetical protein